MFGGKFQVSDIQITERCITKSKKKKEKKYIFLLMPSRQNSPPGSYHHYPGTGVLLIPPRQHFLENLPLLQ